MRTFDVQGAINAGHSMDEINGFLQQNPDIQPSYGSESSMPQLQIQGPQDVIAHAQQKMTGPRPSDFLPTIGAIGLPLAADVLTGGLALPADAALSAIGAGGGEAMKEKWQGKKLNPMAIGEQAAFGGVGALGGGLIAKGAEKLFGNTADSLAQNGLNLTRKQLADFNDLHKVPVSKVMMDNGIAGGDVTSIGKAIKPVQQQFDNIANSTAPIDQNVFLNSMVDTVNKLKESPVPSVQRLGNQVDQALGNVVDRINPNASIGDVNAIRKAFDNAMKDSEFKSERWNANRTAGQVLRKAVQDAADAEGLRGANGETLTQLGQRLNNLYDLQDIAQGRELAGGGGSLMSVTNLIFGGEAGQLGHMMTGMNPLVTGIGAIGARKALTNPRVAGMLAKGAAKGADFFGNPLTNTGLKLAGAGGGSLIASALNSSQNQISPQEADQYNNKNYNSQNTLPPIPGTIAQNGANVNNVQQSTGMAPTINDIPQGVRVDQGGNYIIPNLTAHTAPEAMTFNDYKKLLQQAGQNPYLQEQAARLYQASQTNAENYIKTNGLNDQESSSLKDAYNTNILMNTIRSEMKDISPSVWNRIGTIDDLNKLGGRYATLASNMRQLQAQIGQQLQGGVLRQFDMSFLQNAPQMGDTPQAAFAKLNNLQNQFVNQYMNLYPRYGLTTQ